MYHVFPGLPQINTNSSPSEVSAWKKDPNVARSHKVLFKRESADSSATYMSKIIEKVWTVKKSAPKVHIAYAISVCEFLLNPGVQKVQVSESAIKFNMAKYLQRVANKEKLISDDDDDDNDDAPLTRVEDNQREEGGQEEGGQDEGSQDEGGQEEGGQEGGQEEGGQEGGQEDIQEVIEESGGDDYFSSEEERLKAESLRKKYRKKY